MFQELFNLLQNNQMLTITLMRRDDELVVCVLPTSNGNLGTDLSPLNITAQPMELDEKFIEIISTPVRQRCEVLTNLEEFENSTKKRQEKATQTPKETTPPQSESKPTKSNKQLEDAAKFEQIGNLPAAYALYKKLYEQDKTNTKMGDKMQEVWAKMSQKSLFEDGPTNTNGQLQVVEEIATESGIQTSHQIAVETEIPATDMFQILVDESKTNTSIISSGTPQTAINEEQWKQFQEFQKMQQQGIAVGY